MKKCPFCAEEIQDAAIKCRYCGTQIGEQVARQHQAIWPYPQPMVIASVASLAIFIGVFLPILRLPVVGSLNYFSTGRGDGSILLIAAAVSVGLAIRRRYQWLLATGVPSIVLLLTVFVQLHFRIEQMNASVHTDLKDNPFAGLAEVFLGGVQLEYGWAVLFLGALLLVVAAVIGRASDSGTSGHDGWFGFSRSILYAAGGASLVLVVVGAMARLDRFGNPDATGPATSAITSSPASIDQLEYIAVKTATAYPPPHPIDGIVTLALPSGAWMKVRATDIDYDRTAAYGHDVVVKAQTVTSMTDPATGKPYLRLTFGRFVSTVWKADVDDEVMSSGFAAYYAKINAR